MILLPSRLPTTSKMDPEIVTRFLTGVQSVADRVGAAAKLEGKSSIIVELSQNNFPMWLRLYLEGDTASIVGVVRTVGLDGDRSDYHDVISIIWAAVLRSSGCASVRL